MMPTQVLQVLRDVAVDMTSNAMRGQPSAVFSLLLQLSEATRLVILARLHFVFIFSLLGGEQFSGNTKNSRTK